MYICNDIRNKKNMSSRSYILDIMLIMLKCIHYRNLLIFQNKKPNRFEGQNMGGGGGKRHVIPPCQNMGGYITPSPQDLHP